MNQILETKETFYFRKNNLFIQRKTRKKYLFTFFLSIIIGIILMTYLLFSYFLKLIQLEKTNRLKEEYQLIRLYSTNQPKDVLPLSQDIAIIGLIEIPAIHISYPILSNSSENLLKISVCRFAGPLPNRDGNLCIAGHNYKNSMMFSKLHQLKRNDSIYITDLNNVRLEYKVYDILKVKENNLDCTTNTPDKQLTLITCDRHNNKERTVVKAKVKE